MGHAAVIVTIHGGKAGGKGHHGCGQRHRMQCPDPGPQNLRGSPAKLQHRHGDGRGQNGAQTMGQRQRTAPQGAEGKGGADQGGKRHEPGHGHRGRGFGRAGSDGFAEEIIGKRPVLRHFEPQAQDKGSGGQQGQIGQTFGAFGPDQQGQRPAASGLQRPEGRSGPCRRAERQVPRSRPHGSRQPAASERPASRFCRWRSWPAGSRGRNDRGSTAGAAGSSARTGIASRKAIHAPCPAPPVIIRAAPAKPRTSARTDTQAQRRTASTASPVAAIRA